MPPLRGAWCEIPSREGYFLCAGNGASYNEYQQGLRLNNKTCTDKRCIRRVRTRFSAVLFFYLVGAFLFVQIIFTAAKEAAEGGIMNKVILMGRLTRDPDVRYTQGERQMAIARYTLAVDRRGSQQNSEQTADFIQCVAFDQSAEFAEKYFHQGTKILVTGRIQTGSYTNKDGQKVYTTDVIVEDQEFAESKNAGGQAAAGPGNAPANTGNAFAGSFHANAQPDEGGFMAIPDNVEDDGLPFET